MRLLKELPQIEKRIEQGSLNLTHLGMARALFKQEKISEEQKLEILTKMENQSTREAGRIIEENRSQPKPPKPDRNRADSANTDRHEFSCKRELSAKLQKVRGLLAHKMPNATMADIIGYLCDKEIAESERKTEPKSNSNTVAETRREVWRRASGQCENCGSEHALEIDHVIPEAKGGPSTIENLRLLCRKCNQRAANKEFGVDKMEKHFTRGAAGNDSSVSDAPVI